LMIDGMDRSDGLQIDYSKCQSSGLYHHIISRGSLPNIN